MALWNFAHDILNMHVYLLPSIVVGVAMLVTGIVHGKKQKDRQNDYNEELRNELSDSSVKAAR